MGRLLRYELRILIDPATVLHDTKFFSDLDELQFHLQELQSPCQVKLMFPEYARNRIKPQPISLPHTRFEFLPAIEDADPEVGSALQANETAARRLATVALPGDIDIVLSGQLATRPNVVRGFQRLGMEVLDEREVRRSIEVFVRGHEIPWAFDLSIWQWPWTVFYPHVEAGIEAMERLRALAAGAGLSANDQEYIRSLGLNRWSAIAYTRDKLLFYVLQRRAAKRQKLELQEFTFELTYYLNHYYLLFWGGLDQVCWIVNAICDLGFTYKDRKRVGVTNLKFLERLQHKAPDIWAEFKDPKFLRWIEMLQLTRHHVAHRGFAMLSPIYEEPAEPPTDEEIDRAVDLWPEWQELRRIFPPELLKAFRPLHRQLWRERNYRLVADSAFVIREEGGHARVLPLETISWEFDRFKAFVLGVAEKAIARLSGCARGPASYAGSEPREDPQTLQ